MAQLLRKFGTQNLLLRFRRSVSNFANISFRRYSTMSGQPEEDPRPPSDSESHSQTSDPPSQALSQDEGQDASSVSPAGGKDESPSYDELVKKVKKLEMHVFQLQNIIKKADGSEVKKTWRNRPLDFSKYNKRHIAVKFAYLGWDFNGFADQESSPKTIEAAVFDAFVKTKLIESRDTSKYQRCGRTDKGVSAFTQVISLEVRTNLIEGSGVRTPDGSTAHERKDADKAEEMPFAKMLNGCLPAEIRVIAWCPVEDDFSARFSCQSRTYKYFFPRGQLNLDLMRLAADKLIGLHDFRNFCKMDVRNGVIEYMRRVSSILIEALGAESDDDGYTMCVMTVHGKSFLWHQVRCIAAVLLTIGDGKEVPELIDHLLDVERNPQRPQYAMASELPLVLFGAEFEGTDWVYDFDDLETTIHHMQQMWTKHAVKAQQLRTLLGSLQSIPDSAQEKLRAQNNFVLNGGRPRRHYKPIMQRDVGLSLDVKLANRAKREGIEVDELRASIVKRAKILKGEISDEEIS